MKYSIQHIAIIPDGNRRWAKSQGKNPEEGHLVGFERTKDLIKYCIQKDVHSLSFWGSSINNLTKRSFLEVKNLILCHLMTH